jgi:hypothetical protein
MTGKFMANLVTRFEHVYKMEQFFITKYFLGNFIKTIFL